MDSFATRLLTWHSDHGRKNLPWQQNRTPYRVWVAEVMLQQTQVTTVIPYYQRFLKTFPTVISLSRASDDEIMQCWSGLGYYRRALNLRDSARIVVEKYDGVLPSEVHELVKFKGIGRSTAGAIVAQAFGKPAPILDGNVKRVLSRFHELTDPIDRTATDKLLWNLAAQHMPAQQTAEYTQAIMDLGAMVCRRRVPQCSDCPLQSDCRARRHGTVHTIPVRTNKKQPSHMTLRLALIVDNNRRIYLRKQPHDALWATMWMPPTTSEVDHLSCSTSRRLLHCKQLVERRAIDGFTHHLTHRRIRVQAIQFRYDGATETCEANRESGWFFLAQARQLGIPKVTDKLLDLIDL